MSTPGANQISGNSKIINQSLPPRLENHLFEISLEDQWALSSDGKETIPAIPDQLLLAASRPERISPVAIMTRLNYSPSIPNDAFSLGDEVEQQHSQAPKRQAQITNVTKAHASREGSSAKRKSKNPLAEKDIAYVSLQSNSAFSYSAPELNRANVSRSSSLQIYDQGYDSPPVAAQIEKPDHGSHQSRPEPSLLSPAMSHNSKCQSLLPRANAPAPSPPAQGSDYYHSPLAHIVNDALQSVADEEVVMVFVPDELNKEDLPSSLTDANSPFVFRRNKTATTAKLLRCSEKTNTNKNKKDFFKKSILHSIKLRRMVATWRRKIELLDIPLWLAMLGGILLFVLISTLVII
jgi:hypothetical protein